MSTFKTLFDPRMLKTILSKSKKPLKVYEGIDWQLAKKIRRDADRVRSGRWVSGDPAVRVEVPDVGIPADEHPFEGPLE